MTITNAIVKRQKSHLRSNARASGARRPRDPVILSSAFDPPSRRRRFGGQATAWVRLEEEDDAPDFVRVHAVSVCLRLDAGDRPRRPGSAHPSAQAAGKSTHAQKIDADYTAKIKAATADPRILTELVDHMPASDKVPSPLKFLGYIPGEPGKLTYHKDIVRYLDALDKASRSRDDDEDRRDRRRARHGRASRSPTKRRSRTSTSTGRSPRSSPTRASCSDAQAKQLIATGKPIYYATGSIHSPETGSPEMLMELAYRLAVEETPFIQTIRNNVDRRAHAGERGGRPREAGRQLPRAGRRASRRRRWSTGASTCSTTTTATASASACASRRSC